MDKTGATALPLQENEETKTCSFPIASERTKFKLIYAYGLLVLLSSLVFNTPIEIFQGIKSIVLDPSTLVSDYMEIGSVGAALFNAGILMLVATFIIAKTQVNMNGPAIAAIFTVGGFALFGKNIYNVWAILAGVYLYSRYRKEPMSKFVVAGLFGTALAPLVSQISFGFGLNPVMALIVANIFGLVAGFMVAPLAAHFVNVHQGFNLYNIGFTAGMIATLFMAVMRAFGLENVRKTVLLEGQNFSLGIYMLLLFSSMLMIGIIYNNHKFTGLVSLFKRTGRSPEDFVQLEGFGATMMNMAFLGLMTTAYVLVAKGQLNGPTIGGIFTVAGFGAYGKHVKNTIPVIAGVLLGAVLMQWEINSIGALLAALFGTTLAPISGKYGWKAGVAAGFLHMAMVMNVGGLHGGMNLYNNGFSGGMVAAIMVPILNSIKR